MTEINLSEMISGWDISTSEKVDEGLTRIAEKEVNNIKICGLHEVILFLLN